MKSFKVFFREMPRQTKWNGFAFLFFCVFTTYSSSETQGQSVGGGRNGATKVFKNGRKNARSWKLSSRHFARPRLTAPGSPRMLLTLLAYLWSYVAFIWKTLVCIYVPLERCALLQSLNHMNRTFFDQSHKLVRVTFWTHNEKSVSKTRTRGRGPGSGSLFIIIYFSSLSTLELRKIRFV